MKTDPISYRQGWIDCYEKVALYHLAVVEKAVMAMAKKQSGDPKGTKLLSPWQRRWLTGDGKLSVVEKMGLEIQELKAKMEAEVSELEAVIQDRETELRRLQDGRS